MTIFERKTKPATPLLRQPIERDEASAWGRGFRGLRAARTAQKGGRENMTTGKNTDVALQGADPRRSRPDAVTAQPDGRVRGVREGDVRRFA
jgi:hypothetical protein